MSYIQPPVIPLSFSVERLLQQKGGNSVGGSVGSDSDNDTTPPSSPDSCNSTDLQERQIVTSPYKEQFIVNASSFATLPWIPLSTLAWNPSGAQALAGWRLGSTGPALPLPVGIPRPAAIVPHSSVGPQTIQQQQHQQQRIFHPAARRFSGEKSNRTRPKVQSVQLLTENALQSSSSNSSLTPVDIREQTKTERIPEPVISSIKIHDPNFATSTSKPTSSNSQEDDGSFNNKKKRTTFSSYQLESLEIRFNQQKYLTKHDRSKLAASLGLTEKHIKTWYQNRRTKWKRECSDEVWSKERENAATAMYAQHLQLKSTLSTSESEDNALVHISST